jgi:ATP-dependent Clp protease adapter protein ClpS
VTLRATLSPPICNDFRENEVARMSGPASEASRFAIVFLSDDFTPMEFVNGILQDVFKMSKSRPSG